MSRILTIVFCIAILVGGLGAAIYWGYTQFADDLPFTPTQERSASVASRTDKAQPDNRFPPPPVKPFQTPTAREPSPQERSAPAVNRSYEAQTGSQFLPAPLNPFQAPMVRELALPPFSDATAVWGATGRDDDGNIWVGVSATHDGKSAHLMRYDAALNLWQDAGNAVDQLSLAGLRRNGEGQIKIHTKIIPADDGYLYFASTDEEGEKSPGDVLPRWGGHLWRIDRRSGKWQHLMTAKEGLVAAAGVGRYVYLLGYWDHVLYQYDTTTGKTRRTVVGSLAGHVSRNFVADVHGHAYVPRLSVRANGKVIAELIQFDKELKEIAATPLEYYLGTEPPGNSHGIAGLTYLAEGRILFTTHRGYLYAIDPKADGPATVTAVGWFHPKGEAYAPSLFSFTGKSLLAGVTVREGRYEWVIYDQDSRFSSAYRLDTHGLENVLLYGSVTRDNAGRFYVGGWAKAPNGGSRPLMLQIAAAP